MKQVQEPGQIGYEKTDPADLQKEQRAQKGTVLLENNQVPQAPAVTNVSRGIKEELGTVIAALSIFASGFVAGQYSPNLVTKFREAIGSNSVSNVPAKSAAPALSIAPAVATVSSKVVVSVGKAAGSGGSGTGGGTGVGGGASGTSLETVGEDIDIPKVELPELLSDAAFRERLIKLNLMIDPEEIPTKTHMSVMYLKGVDEVDERTGYKKFVWTIAQGSLRMKDQTILAIKVTNPALRSYLAFTTIKYKWRTFENGVDYFYYECAVPPKNQASVALMDPNPVKESILQNIGIFLTPCK